MYRIKVITDNEKPYHLEGLSQTEISEIIKPCHHSKRGKNNYSVICMCNQKAELIVRTLPTDKDKFILVPQKCTEHEPGCIFFKDGITNIKKFYKKDEKGEVIEIDSFTLKKRKIKDEKEEFEKIKISEDEKDAVELIKDDPKAMDKRQQRHTLGAIFTKIINEKYEANTKRGFTSDFTTFMNGLDWDFKRKALGEKTIFEFIKNNEIAFGKIIGITKLETNKYKFQIQCMKTIVDRELEYWPRYKEPYQYIFVSEKEYQYACEKYILPRIDIADKINFENENFYFVGLINKSKNLTNKNINCKNVYILSCTNNGLITDSLFENELFNKLYNQGYQLFYKPSEIKYINLATEEYKYLADAVIYPKTYVKNEKGKITKPPYLNKYILLEFFGIKGMEKYEALRKKKEESGKEININHEPDICFMEIDIANKLNDLKTVIEKTEEMKN